MDTIFAIRLVWAEIIINSTLLIANLAMHIRARRILKGADAIWREAIAYRAQAEKILKDAKADTRT